jgi:signal-transduction protein with cAMP-binding, CBS, and nucleotidyltransferase domain
MKVRDVMHSPSETCRADTTLMEAARKLLVAEVGMLVVTDDDGHPVGVVTDRDLALRGYARGLAAESTVAKVMSHEVVMARLDDDVFEATALMAARGIRRLPVVDGRAVEGVIALDDLTLLLSRETADVARAVAAQSNAGRYGGWSDWDEA